MSHSKNELRLSTIVEFILRLQEDFKFLAEFNKEPDKVMIEAGITSEEDRNILKSRDVLKIRQLLAERKSDNNNNNNNTTKQEK
jgi:hypothetical protein